VTDVTDELVAKLHARRDHGTKKYGKTLLPFDGRNTEYDIEEELLDALVYVTKMRMERENVAKLLDRAGDCLSWLEDFFPGELNTFALAHVEPVTSEELWEVTRRLRTDVPRIGVPATRHLSGGPMERLEDMEKS
jgi:hypothetical protein